MKAIGRLRWRLENPIRRAPFVAGGLRPRIERLEDRCVPAVVYPNVGAFPIPMNSQPGDAVQWAEFYKGFDAAGTPTLNPDGTQLDNPVILVDTKTVDGVVYVRYSLSSETKVTFGATDYVVYSNVPQNMTIDYAYSNASEYYPATVDTTNYDFPATPPTTINKGKASSIGAPALSPHTNEQVVLATNPDNPATPTLAYYIPNLPNSAGKHDGLTNFVGWNLDQYLGATPNPRASGKPFHLNPYGWAEDPGFADASIIWHNLDQTGGQDAGAPTTLVQVGPPFNNWFSLLSGLDNYNQASPPADPAMPPIPGLQHYLFNAFTANAANNPFPKPTWLENGVYLPFVPLPGFQSNLLRYYTAWGAWNLFDNTSGLFVRADGSVELPYDTTANAPYPLVTQNWEGSQRFTVLNLTGKAIPSVQTNYPGGEAYFAQNVFLPGQAGVWQTNENYTVWDASGALDARSTDGWLGFLGDTVAETMLWSDANNGLDPSVLNGQTEPGGQANKPYMFSSITIDNGATQSYTVSVKSSNSFPIAQLLETEVAGRSYEMSLHVDQDDGKGYVKAATFSYEWQPWTIGGTQTSPIWTKSSNNYGAMIPKVDVAADFLARVSTAVGSNWTSNARTLSYSARPYMTADANALNGAPMQFIIEFTSSNAKFKWLLVLEPDGTNASRPTFGSPPRLAPLLPPGLGVALSSFVFDASPAPFADEAIGVGAMRTSNVFPGSVGASPQQGVDGLVDSNPEASRPRSLTHGLLPQETDEDAEKNEEEQGSSAQPTPTDGTDPNRPTAPATKEDGNPESDDTPKETPSPNASQKRSAESRNSKAEHERLSSIDRIHAAVDAGDPFDRSAAGLSIEHPQAFEDVGPFASPAADFDEGIEALAIALSIAGAYPRRMSARQAGRST